MRLTFFFLVLFALANCASEPEPQPENFASANSIPDEEEIIEEEKSEKLDIAPLNLEEIKSVATQGFTDFVMDSLSVTEPYVDSSRFNASIFKLPVGGDGNYHLFSNDYLRFSWHQWEEINDYFYCTFIADDDNCCVTLYMCIADKNGTPLAVSEVGLRGGDAGWNQADYGKVNGKTLYRVFKNESMINFEYEYAHNEDGQQQIEFNKYEVIFDFKSPEFKIDTIRTVKTDTIYTYVDSLEKYIYIP